MSTRPMNLRRAARQILPLYPSPSRFLWERLGPVGQMGLVVLVAGGGVFLVAQDPTEEQVVEPAVCSLDAEGRMEMALELYREGWFFGDAALDERLRVDILAPVDVRWKSAAASTRRALEKFTAVKALVPRSALAVDADEAIGLLYIDSYLVAGMAPGDSLVHDGVMIRKRSHRLLDGDEWGDLEETVLLEFREGRLGPGATVVVHLERQDFTLQQLIRAWRSGELPEPREAGMISMT